VLLAALLTNQQPTGFGSGALIERETDGRFIASIPDLGDLAASGDTDIRGSVSIALLRPSDRFEPCAGSMSSQ
jgi:hypothetical protein